LALENVRIVRDSESGEEVQPTDCGTHDPGRKGPFGRFRAHIAGLFVVAGFAALLTLGWAGVSAAPFGYGYGYGYGYEYDTGHLIVIKHVVNDNGGGAVAANFTMTIGGVTATGGNSFPGAESPGTDKEVTPGSYSVTETGPSGYGASFSVGCTGTIAAGETKTCTVTNDDQAAHLIVIKHVINDNNGHSVASNFSMRINGVVVQGANPFPGAESPGTNKTVNAGSYTVTETGPSGYVAFFSANCTGTIAVGQTKTCTVTNNDIAPRQTMGYWKNHPAQTTALLPQLIGSYNVNTFARALAIFNAASCSSSSQAINCLAGQLLAAELNLANASDPCITPTVNKANTFLSGGTVTVNGVTATGPVYTGPGNYTLNANQRTVALALKDALDAYNNNNKRCTNP
jgi:Prealbumin-like fold domain